MLERKCPRLNQLHMHDTKYEVEIRLQIVNTTNRDTEFNKNVVHNLQKYWMRTILWCKLLG